MVKFIVLSTQRSGSTFLVTALSSHPRIHCYEEIFLRTNHNSETYLTYRTATLNRRLAHLFQRKQLIAEYLMNLYTASEPSGDAVGFKLMYPQIRQLPEITAWIKEHKIKVIHLIRQNTLKVIVSHQAAKKRKLYHLTRPLEQVSKIHLPPRKVKTSLVYLTQQVQKYRRIFADNPYLEVTYESFVAHQDYETQRILQFLQIEPFIPLTSPLVKINPDSLPELIENYEEITRVLRGTTFEQFLA